jgi:hypothetical protein
MPLSPTFAAIRVSNMAPFAHIGADRAPVPTLAARRADVL